MKNLITILTLLTLSSYSYAFEFTITDICEDKLVLNENIEILNDVSAGDLTIYMFDQYQIPYSGNIGSITSIFNTKTGLDSYEVISDSEMKVFGWCYEIDGVQPEVIMSEVIIDPTVHKNMNWFYGYAHYKEGIWLSYCTPVHKDKNDFICK
jgi:hypothetical protein